MIGSCNCPIIANCLITLSDLQLCRLIRAKYSSVYAPIRFEETVIVMIRREIFCFSGELALIVGV